MALDSRPRPVRRPARRRVPLLTALALLVMAAGLWFSGPSARPLASSVPAPRLQVADAQVAAATGQAQRSAAAEPAPEAEATVSVVTSVTAPVTEIAAAVPAAVALPVGGPRAPPLG